MYIRFLIYIAPCMNLECFNGGNCIENPNVEAGAYCECRDGYDGQQCEFGMY